MSKGTETDDFIAHMMADAQRRREELTALGFAQPMTDGYHTHCLRCGAMVPTNDDNSVVRLHVAWHATTDAAR